MATNLCQNYKFTSGMCLAIAICYSLYLHDYGHIQYSLQVTSRVHALRGMRAREKLVRAQGALEKLRAKPKPLESWTIANLPARLLLRVLAQSWHSPYIKFTSQNIVTCSYSTTYLYLILNVTAMLECLVGSPVTCSRDSWRSKYKQHCWVQYDSTGGVRQLTKMSHLFLLCTWSFAW